MDYKKGFYKTMIYDVDLYESSFITENDNVTKLTENDNVTKLDRFITKNQI